MRKMLSEGSLMPQKIQFVGIKRMVSVGDPFVTTSIRPWSRSIEAFN